MIIAGGSYLEECRYPYWNRLFGSGLRAALALQTLSPHTELHTYAPPAYKDDIEATLAGAGLGARVTEAVEEMRFEWLHPYQLVESPNARMDQLEPLQMAADVVLRFGMLEGSARVTARRAVYSVQNEVEGFSENGSTADELVMVASERELRRILPDGESTDDRIALLFEGYAHIDHFALLLRNEFGDVSIRQRGGLSVPVRTYAAESYFKIGSGDVFSAAFAHAWMEAGQDIETAADRAARSLAWFIQDARLPLPRDAALPTRRAAPLTDRVRILGSETLEMGQLLIKTVDWLEAQEIGLKIERGDGDLSSDMPTLVLIGSRASPFEVAELGRRTARLSHLVVFDNGQAPLAPYFPRARIVGDYASALYHLLRSGAA